MFKIAISNHPTFEDITREAEMIKLVFDKIITMELKITHKIGDKEFKEYNKTVRLEISNNVQIPTGEGDETIGNLDYFVANAEAGASLKALVTAGIAMVDDNGTLNAKCKYKDVVVEEPEI